MIVAVLGHGSPRGGILFGYKEGLKMSKQDTPYTVERVFVGERTAEELVADLIRAHEG